MGNINLENNTVALVGKVATGFTFSHEVFGEKFYMFKLGIERTSAYVDYIPIIVSERLLDVSKDLIDTYVYVSGSYRSFNLREGDKTKLLLTAFADEIEVDVDYELTNNIFLDGFVCKEPVYRKTPLGREIADVLLAVNRTYGKSDYIPCVLWGRNAKYASSFAVGEHIRLSGRIQSREYKKLINENEFETRVAYEVSVAKVEEV